MIFFDDFVEDLFRTMLRASKQAAKNANPEPKPQGDYIDVEATLVKEPLLLPEKCP